MKFERGGPTGNTDAGELVIENDRLKTTIMVLQQKLKVQDDTEGVNTRLQSEVREHEETVENLKNQVEELTAEVKQLRQKLEVSTNKYNSTISTTVSENERKYA
jgi:predicted RNase H-like nuclease (RuvC/YqgF family)